MNPEQMSDEQLWDAFFDRRRDDWAGKPGQTIQKEPGLGGQKWTQVNW